MQIGSIILLAAVVAAIILLVLILLWIAGSIEQPYNKNKRGPFKVFWPWTDRSVFHGLPSTVPPPAPIVPTAPIIPSSPTAVPVTPAVPTTQTTAPVFDLPAVFGSQPVFDAPSGPSSQLALPTTALPAPPILSSPTALSATPTTTVIAPGLQAGPIQLGSATPMPSILLAAPSAPTPPMQEISQPIRSSGCEGAHVNFTCPTGKSLRLDSAFYGRNSPNVCPGPGSTTVTNCSAPGAFTALGSRINGKNNVTVRMGNTDIGGPFTDPCFGVVKHYDVTYSCV